MLDYAISQNLKQGPTRRTVVCWTASCVSHLLFFVALIQFPQLLEGGYYHQFRGIRGDSEPDEDSQNWRTVAILESSQRMKMPSLATLKKDIANWDKKGSGAPPIRVRFGDLTAALSNLPPMPKTSQKSKEPKSPLPANDVVSSGPDVKPVAEAGSAPKEATPDKGTSAAAAIASRGESRVETAGNAAPAKIPDSIRPPATSSPGGNVKAAANDQSSTRSSGIVLSDTKGFPMGNYKDVIVERVKEKWFIPSNLKNSQGKTTVIFYIDKDGRCINLRVASPSGSNSLDLAALSAVTESDPFPPLPKGFPGDHIGVKLVLIVEP